MPLNIFNACLIAGWLLVSVGAAVMSLGLGLVVSGGLLIVLTLLLALRFGVFTPEPAETPKGD